MKCTLAPMFLRRSSEMKRDRSMVSASSLNRSAKRCQQWRPSREGSGRCRTAPRLGYCEGDSGQAMIRVEISEDAQADLNEGFLFYEAQAAGLGDYFIACLRADIEGLKISGVHIGWSMRMTIGCSASYFRTAFSTRWRARPPWCGRCSTSEETRNGYANNCESRISNA